MLEKGEKFFRFKVGPKEQVITVDRLKPAFGFADPTPQTAEKKKEVRAAPPKKEIKKSLNPEAEASSRAGSPRRASSRAGSPKRRRRLRPNQDLAAPAAPQKDWE